MGEAVQALAAAALAEAVQRLELSCRAVRRVQLTVSLPMAAFRSQRMHACSAASALAPYHAPCSSVATGRGPPGAGGSRMPGCGSCALWSAHKRSGGWADSLLG